MFLLKFANDLPVHEVTLALRFLTEMEMSRPKVTLHRLWTCTPSLSLAPSSGT